jgi:hypothetical protein
LGFGFYFSKNPVFDWVLGFFKIKKKKLKFSSKIVMKEEKNLRKSFNSSNLQTLVPPKIFDGQPLHHKIVRLLNGPRTDPTDLWRVGPKSVDNGF